MARCVLYYSYYVSLFNFNIGMVEALHQELRYSHPDNKIHLMNVSPFIIDTGMVKGASIRFPSEFTTVML